MEYFIGGIIFILGLVLGSFFNVCIYRIPQKQSIVKPASHCMECGYTLRPLDLVPLVSWLALKGKCRNCKSKISARYPLIELLTGLLFLFNFIVFGLSSVSLINTAFISVLIIVSFIDIDVRIINDRFIFVIALLALLNFFISKHYIWQEAVLGGLIGGGFILLADLMGRLIFKKAGMGFGDVKLMAVSGLFLAWKNVLVALLFAIWSAAIVGIYILRKNRPTVIEGEEYKEDEHKEESTGTSEEGFEYDDSVMAEDDEKDGDRTYMPFGPFLSIGCVIALLWGDRIVTWYLSNF